MTGGPYPSVSDIAWPAEADDAATDAAARLGFRGVELAPANVFRTWPDPDPAEVAEYRARLDAKGLVVPALQGILFGQSRAKLFGNDDERTALRRHLETVARLAGRLGAKACVFGAPGARDPGGLAPETAMEQAAAFFSAVAPAFADEGAALAFEANATLYGCKFVTHTRQAIELVRRVGHPGFRLQLDMGTVTINAEPLAVIGEAARLAAHVHVSEPRLAPVGSLDTKHNAYGEALKQAGWKGWISIEMAKTADWEAALAAARGVLAAHYEHCGNG